MSRLDDELRLALQRREVSPDFTARVMARVAGLPAPPATPWEKFLALFRLPARRFAVVSAIACLVIGLTFGAQYYRQYQAMKKEGEIAKAQVMLAFQIASSKLHKAKQKVSEAAERSAALSEESGEPQSATKPKKNHGEK